MNPQSTLPFEDLQEIVQELATAPAPHSRETLLFAFDRLRNLFYRFLKQHTRDCHISFTSPFARLEYLSKAHDFVGTDGYRRINDFRARLNRLRHGGGEVYISDHLIADDALALSHFFAHIEQCDIPVSLALLLPSVYSRPVKGGEQEQPTNTVRTWDSSRVVVQSWDATSHLILATDEAEGEQMRILVLPNAFGDWQYLFPLLKADATLSLVRPSLAADGYVRAELIIYEPDLLVDTSSISHCIKPYGASPRNYLIHLFSSVRTSPAILLGNLASQMLDEEILAASIDQEHADQVLTEPERTDQEHADHEQEGIALERPALGQSHQEHAALEREGIAQERPDQDQSHQEHADHEQEGIVQELPHAQQTVPPPPAPVQSPEQPKLAVPLPDYPHTITRFFSQQAILLATCAELQDPEQRAKFHAEARQQQLNIRNIVRQAFVEDRQIHLDRILLEPSFVAPMLGIQGRMDLLQDDLAVLMEQKSGKLEFRTNAVCSDHYAQMLLYFSYLHYCRGMRNEQVSSYLLYSKYPDGLKQTTTVPARIGQAFMLRNGIVWLQQSLADGGVRVMEQWQPDLFNDNHIFGTLWEQYCRPQLSVVLDTIRHATPLERAYFYRMVTFVAREHLLSKAGNSEKETGGFASLWNASLSEKLQSGDIMHGLQLDSFEASRSGEGYDLIHITLDTEAEDTLPNFREGDIVILYRYPSANEPDVRQELILRAAVLSMASDGIVLRLRAPQRNASVFHTPQGYAWAIEHDLMESSFTGLYRSCFSFLQAPLERRELLLGQREPEVDTSVQLVGDYGGAYFNDLVLRARQARDFFIVMGPPGTGKTSYGMVNILRETQLAQPQSNILLMSYTNRAVDEICSKLVGLELPFIRMGNDLQCPEVYRPYLLSAMVDSCSGASEIRRHLADTHILVGTTSSLSSRLDLMSLKQFDLAIVDEASQILEPHLLALLSATASDGLPAIRKFVFIGDHKQLPAVVQQSPEASLVHEKLLNDIGLTDCRQSLFERLHALYAGRPDVEYHLTRQGRMHADVAVFSSEFFYDSHLVPVPLEHQLQPLASLPVLDADSAEMHLLSSHRVAFLDSSVLAARDATSSVSSANGFSPSGIKTPSGMKLLPDKVNPCEADLTARLVYAYYQLHCERGGETFDPRQTIGVIVPYRNQIAMVRRALSRYGIPALLEISIDTVERYQGSQRDLIIYSFSVRRPYQLDFLTSSRIQEGEELIDRKLNVALTRARLQMILIGHVPLLRRDPLFARLIDRYLLHA